MSTQCPLWVPVLWDVLKFHIQEFRGVRLLQLLEIFLLWVLHFRNEVSLSEETPDHFSCFLKLANCTFQWILVGYIEVVLFSALPGALLLPSAFSHTDAETMQVLWLLMVYCHSLYFGILEDILSLNLVLHVLLFNFSSSFYVGNLGRSKNYSAVRPHTIF